MARRGLLLTWPAAARGWLRGIGIAALSIGAAAALVEAVAAVRSRRLRAERAVLGDGLYTEIRGEVDPLSSWPAFPPPRASGKGNSTRS